MTTTAAYMPPAFDINEGVDVAKGGVRWPEAGPGRSAMYSADDYFQAFAQVVDGPGSAGALVEVLKGAVGGAPPALTTFATLTTMPNAYNQGIAQPPGIPFAILKKLADEHFLPKVIIQQRVADIMRYAEPSTQPWKPGWKIEMREGMDHPTAEDKKDMAAATSFLINCCGIPNVGARQRDELQLTSFRDYLSAITRDSFRFDWIATWTDMSLGDEVRAFKALPASQIRNTVGNHGYRGDKTIFAVGVDDANKVTHTFTRKQLSVGRRNARTDADAAGYGYSELEMAVRLVQGFTNAFEFNVSLFDKNATPNGILTTTGNWNSKQLDVLSRMWANLKRGTSKTWALPVIPMPKDGKLEVLDLSQLKGNDAYYQDLTNMLGGLYCAISQYPVSRLGYRSSGRGPDNNPKDHQTSGTLVDEADPGLPGFLGFLERHINEYLIWSRWPRLQARFQGKNPKEDARAYEAQMLSSTWDEKRALTDKCSVMDLAKSPEQKEVMEIMCLAPVDPNLASTFMATIQMIRGQAAAAAAGGKQNEMVSKRDPGVSLEHGHEGGVRRNSAAERKSAAAAASATKKAAPQGLYVARPVLNTADVIGWARRQGFESVLAADDLRVTVCWSREPMDWDAVLETAPRVVIPQGGPREVKVLGDKGAVVLMFSAWELSSRWQELRDLGASWDYDTYRPHMTITYKGLAGLDLEDIVPYDGPIILGPEVFDLPDADWDKDKG